MIGNQMPSYLIYMIAGGLGVCIIGIVVIVLVIRKRRDSKLILV